MTIEVPHRTSAEDDPWQGYTIDPFSGKPRPRESSGGLRRRGLVIRTDGKPACLDCGRPVERTRGGRDGRKPQSRCNACHAKYERQRRAGKVQVLLTPQEWAGVKAARAAGWPIGGGLGSNDGAG